MTNSKYTVCIADPPWRAGQLGHLGAESHYSLMTDEAIKAMGPALQEHMLEDSVCFLWVTNATIKTGHEVLEAWGYKYSGTITWIKARMGLGHPLRNMTEHVLLGVRGRPPKPAFRGQGTWFFAPVQSHSHKPEEFFDIVDRLYPEGRRLELFARRPRSGYQAWGNEIASDIDLEGFPVPNSPATRASS
ncbi:methyltransferase [Plantibacter sp. CFBP 8798]|uniref:MT-A70 family methyltransferase n=1 Tax=Plantibacter sp. CFBP 8798 TaxID=2775268 RepID=UPI00177EBD92|nr:MT-A70 family methyltransferase [Plantibacter sp. CFBP 8798]MBD8467087.1 methyltransferase [Plantibacter sp. CFBP 8798]